MQRATLQQREIFESTCSADGDGDGDADADGDDDDDYSRKVQRTTRTFALGTPKKLGYCRGYIMRML